MNFVSTKLPSVDRLYQLFPERSVGKIVVYATSGINDDTALKFVAKIANKCIFVCRISPETSKTVSLQQNFLDLLNSKLAPGERLVNVLMDVLYISSDSAYRRIRGDTTFSMPEFISLSKHFNISADAFIGSSSEDSTALFQTKSFNNEILSYIQFVQTEFSRPPFTKNFELIYAAKGLPVYYNFIFPEIASFKAFYYYTVLWMNPSVQIPKYEFVSFYNMLSQMQPGIKQIEAKIKQEYLQTPTTEIWNASTLDGHLHQVRYAWETGLFKDKESALVIVDKTSEMLEHTRRQAEAGKKLNPEKMEDEYAEFHIYFMEAVNLEHTCWRKIGERTVTFINHNIGDFIFTFNEDFCVRTESYLKNLLEKSVYISRTGQKERHRLFSRIAEKIENLRKLVENY